MTRANPKGEIIYVDDIERRARELKKVIRTALGKTKEERKVGENMEVINDNLVNNAQNGMDGQQDPLPREQRQVPPRQSPHILQRQPQYIQTTRDYLEHDFRGIDPKVTEPEIEADHFELKPVIFNMINTLGQFRGTATEDARLHLRGFLDIYKAFKIHRVHQDVLRMRLFPYSLRNRAKQWLNNQLARSFNRWTELCNDFLDRFSPSNVTDRLRNEITAFRQGDDEPMYEAWERYQHMLNNYPLYGFLARTHLSMFYNGVNYPTRMMIDASSNRIILDKPLEEALWILNQAAKNDYKYPTARRGGIRRPTIVNEVEASESVNARLDKLTELVMNMVKPTGKVYEAKVVKPLCDECGANHDSSECTTSANFMGGHERNSRPSTNTYNLGWKNNPNFS
ncbi:hypothetical protein HRI_000123100 [Hibiscus trionum]|uniref:Retrotransposon gag domain-containing protein n=1 Tax=Hibiscus trionum TaxID=183268 RepID=A0A9W7GUA6_HIBTR|nr:hypothetical protein HRI_000123100 [Hibiscus trionum]